MHPAIRSAAAALTAITLLGACTSTPHAPVSPAEVGELRPGAGYLKGYLGREELPDSLALLPPPPAEGTPATRRPAAPRPIKAASRKSAKG